MHERTALAEADVSDAALTDLVATLLGHPAADVTLLESSAEIAPYDLEALTTAGRYRVRGRAATPAGEQPFSFFVKVVQSWGRTPLFAFVPPELRELALASVPWQIEPTIYRSDLPERLPTGLSMPTAFAVNDIDDESAAIWLQDIDVVPLGWDTARCARAAYLLGRLAASPRVRPLAGVGRNGQPIVRGYAEGRVAGQLVPALISVEIWGHPLIAGAFDDELHARLVAAARNLGSLVDELAAAPLGAFHGDACTRNLLVERASGEFVLIDYGFWGEGPLGFDLAQLLIGEVQMGERSAAELPELEKACLTAYVEGLRAEGCEVPFEVIERAHALQMLLFAGLSAIPLEHLDQIPTPELQRIARERADSARFILDLVDATAQTRSGVS
jgi:hypothetical protein